MERHPPRYPGKLIVVLFGKRVQLKNSIGKTLLENNDVFSEMSNNFVVEKNSTFKIINSPDFFDEKCLHPDQLIIDVMAHSLPGANLFILAIDSENTQEEKVVAQISELQDAFGKGITAHLVVTLPDIESFHSLSHLKYKFNTRLAIPNENMASECKKWCLANEAFQYDYKNYSEDVVKRRKTALEKRRYDGHPNWREGANHMTPSTSQQAFAAPERPASNEQYIGNLPASARSDNIFNIIVLGLTGTGKSASANTILTAFNSKLDSRQLFKSISHSMPVTKQCEFKLMEKAFGTPVRVVDTPDFFNEHVRDSQVQVEECKKYCQRGQCVVLLVFQLGRFTDHERGILEKLEAKMGWRIRESTIVLLTHGEELKGSLELYIDAYENLKSIIEQCGNRYHLFNNKSSENSKQVTELIKGIQNSKIAFPKLAQKNRVECCVS